MADFPTALTAELESWYRPTAGVKSAVTTTRGFAARLSALEKHYGSKKAAAKAAGVGHSSWQAWTAGGTAKSKRSVSKINQAKVGVAYTLLLRDRVTGRKSAPAMMSIKAVVVAHEGNNKYKNSTPYRWFNAIDVRDWTPVTEAWRAGQSAQDVAKAAEDTIEEAYGTRFTFEEGTDGGVVVDLS